MLIYFQRQNRQLHTHEQILCYQLQQKKRLLSELKAELEYCRKKWALARALNSESEEQCKQLRHEFSMRKIQDQNSAESGYSDEHPSDADADDDEAGTSKKLTKVNTSKVQTYDENLSKFDRTTSPTFSERRQSESPLIHNFSSLNLFTRAQSEQPRVPSPMNNEPDEVDIEVFEVLDLIPNPIYERCIALPIEECESRMSASVATPPPDVHFHDPPKLKAHLRKHKKRNVVTGQTESAEAMFRRLMNTVKDTREECSTCSSTTASLEEDELDSEIIETIQELPLDEVVASIVPEDCAISLEEACEVVESISPAIIDEPQPSTSEVKDDITSLTVKEQEYLQRREARLTRLEAEAQAFYDKMAKNKDKGIQLNNHINDVHQTFLDRNRQRTKSEDDKSKDEPSTSGAVEKVEEAETEQKDDEK